MARPVRIAGRNRRKSRRKSHVRTALASTALLSLAAPAWAQEDLAEKAKDIAEQANDVQAQAGALANEAANASAEREGRGDRDGSDAAADDASRATGAGDGRDDRDGGDGGKWGLLGLLGLAGLLGLRRRPGHSDPLRDRRP